MTREQAKQKLVAVGVAEPTDEQITEFLNTLGAEAKKEKERADKLKLDADKAAELQKQLDELQNAQLSEIEKANKATEQAMSQLEAMKRELSETKFRQGLAEKGISGEYADGIVKSLMSGDFAAATETIGKLLTDRESAAAKEKEKEFMSKMPNIQGTAGGEGENGSTAEQLAKQLFSSEKPKVNVIEAYLKGGI